jgi:DNA-binding MarR family transcriptional regulator
MQLEQEIHQGRFKSEYQKLTINILYTANWLTTKHSRSLKEFGLTPEQFNILRILRGQHPRSATVNLLIERMLNKMSNASRLVEKLRKKGLAERQTDSHDRRACAVHITPKGLRILTKIDRVEQKWHKTVALLSKAEAKKVNSLLDKLRG